MLRSGANILLLDETTNYLDVDGVALSGAALSVTVSLGRSCGGGFYLTPDASADDGLFDICWLGDFGRFEALRALPKGPQRHAPGSPAKTSSPFAGPGLQSTNDER